MWQVIPSFLGSFSENFVFNSTDNFENFLVCRNYCVASHSSGSCSLFNCQFHFLSIADKDRNELIGKLDRLCFTG